MTGDTKLGWDWGPRNAYIICYTKIIQNPMVNHDVSPENMSCSSMDHGGSPMFRHTQGPESLLNLGTNSVFQSSCGRDTSIRHLCLKLRICYPFSTSSSNVFFPYMGMDQYLLIPFLGGWTSIYQLFWCSPGVQGFDTLPYNIMFNWWFHLFCISNFHMFVHCLFLYIFIMSLFFHKFFQSGGPSGPSGQGLSLVISLLQKLPSLAEVVNQVRSR